MMDVTAQLVLAELLFPVTALPYHQCRLLRLATRSRDKKLQSYR